MDSSPLFREVCFLVQVEKDVEDAVSILKGETTVSIMADERGQENASFYGDGDVLILSCTKDSTALDTTEAETALGDRGDHAFLRKIIPAIQTCEVPIELVIRHCNLSRQTVSRLAQALKANLSLIGFSIFGNHNYGMLELKHACIETRAPLKWFQGKPLSENLLAKRTIFEHARENCGNDMPSSHSSSRDIPCLVDDTAWDELNAQRRTRPSLSSSENLKNEREEWLTEMKEKLRSVYEVEEIDNVLASIELYELQKKIESILIL